MFASSSALIISTSILLFHSPGAEEINEAKEGGTCNLCIDGSVPENADLSLPNAVIAGIPLSSVTCSSVDTLLQVFVPNRTSEECSFVQALGPYCGCPNAKPELQDRCSFCGDDDPTDTMQFGDNELPFLEEMFGFIPTCALLEAFLMSVEEDDGLCSTSKELLAPYCGCHKEGSNAVAPSPSEACTLCPSEEGVAFPDKDLGIEGFPLKTCGDLESAISLVVEESSETCELLQRLGSICGCGGTSSSKLQGDRCVMCPRGFLKYPNRTVSMFGDTFYGYKPTCEIMEALVQSSDSDSDECRIAQFTSGFCGCDPPPNQCNVCGTEDPGKRDKSYDDKVIPQHFLEVLGIKGANLTCGVGVEYFAPQFQVGTTECYIIQRRGDVCGCNDGKYQYYGAHSNRRKRASVWCPRFAGFLSLLGTSAIVYHVIKSRDRRRNMYCQIMLGMSILDFFASIAWILSTAARERDPVLPVYSTHGTKASCTIQAFLFQCGVGSTFYAATLITYFFLVIVLSKRGAWLERQRWWLHGIPITCTLAICIPAFSFAFSSDYGCHINFSGPATWLVYYPVLAVMAYCLFIMAWIVLYVRRVAQRGRKWQFPIYKGGRRSSGLGTYPSRPPRRLSSLSVTDEMERKVMKKALIYVFNFLVTWPMIICAFFLLVQEPREDFNYEKQRELYWLYLVALTLAPLQGAFNSIAFFYKRGNGPGTRRKSQSLSTRQLRTLRSLDPCASFTTNHASFKTNHQSSSYVGGNDDCGGAGDQVELRTGCADDQAELGTMEDVVPSTASTTEDVVPSRESTTNQPLESTWLKDDPSMRIARAPSRDDATPDFQGRSGEPIHTPSRRRSQNCLETEAQLRKLDLDCRAGSERSKSFSLVLGKLAIWSNAAEEEQSNSDPQFDTSTPQQGPDESESLREDDNESNQSAVEAESPKEATELPSETLRQTE